MLLKTKSFFINIDEINDFYVLLMPEGLLVQRKILELSNATKWQQREASGHTGYLPQSSQSCEIEQLCVQKQEMILESDVQFTQDSDFKQYAVCLRSKRYAVA